jgi:hypothetical protein
MPIYVDPRKDKDLIRRAEGDSNGPQQKRSAKPNADKGTPRRAAQKPVQREQELMRGIIDYLTYRGAVVVRVNSGGVPVEGKDGRYFIRLAGKGTSDILACYQSHFLAIECKVGDNTASAAQTQFLADVRRAGGIGIVAYSIEDVAKELERCQ